MRILLALLAASCFLLSTVALPAGDSEGSKESAIPFKRTEEVAGAPSLWRVVLGFGVVVAIGVGALYLLKRYVPSSVGRLAAKGGRIDVLEIRRVTARLTLFLIKVDEETVLLTQSGDCVELLQLKPPGSSFRDMPPE
jgi:flagellar biogenesis protein FliO